MQKSENSNSDFQQSDSDDSFEDTINTQFIVQAKSHQESMRLVQVNQAKPITESKPKPQEFDFQHNYPIELIFILYHSYKGRIQQLCKVFDCNFIFGLNLIKFYGKDKSKLEKCQETFKNLTSKIKYTPFKCNQDPSEKSKPFKLLHSYYFNAKFKKYGISLLSFNQNVFAFTDQLSQKQLSKKQTQISQQKLIFPVKLRSYKNLNSQPVYKEIAQFLSKAFHYYKEQFQSHKLNVQINVLKSYVYVIGNNARSCMIGKNTVKNILEGMICYTLKGIYLSEKEYKLMGKYFVKLSKYPIHLGKISDNQYLIITKDTIMKQFVAKPKFLQLSKMTNETQIGIFLLQSFNRQQKCEVVHRICKQNGFHMKYQNFFQYFQNTFIHNQDTNSAKPLVNILLKIAEGHNQGKQRYELMKKFQTKSHYHAENQNSQLDYFVIGGKLCHQELSQRISRDVMCEKIEMKKNFVVKYNLSEQEQINDVCWTENPKTNQVTEVNFQDAKKGNYFYGKKKNYQGKTLYKKQYYLTII